MNNKRYYDRKMSMIVKDGSDSVLKRFEVHNYKNFKDTLVFDFSNVGGYKFNEECTIAHRFVGKSIIYGRNATGKTNLGNAILDIRKVVIGSFRYPPKIKFLKNKSIMNPTILLIPVTLSLIIYELSSILSLLGRIFKNGVIK